MFAEISRLYWTAVKRRQFRRADGFWSGLDLVPRQARLEARLGREVEAFRRDPAGLRVPDFVIIGVPKSATSWLRAMMDRHPAIKTVEDEIEFFAENPEIGLRRYLAHFQDGPSRFDRTHRRGRVPHGSIVIGEKSASTAAMPLSRIRLMHRLMPEARLIIMLRDPVDRHWAHAKRFFSKSRFAKKVFDLSEVPAVEFDLFFEATRRFGLYSQMLERWWSIYGEEALLVLFQEDIADDPAGFVGKTLSHVGVDPAGLQADSAALSEVRNRGPEIAMPPSIEARLRAMFADEYSRLESMLGRLPDAWHRHAPAPGARNDSPR